MNNKKIKLNNGTPEDDLLIIDLQNGDPITKTQSSSSNTSNENLPNNSSSYSPESESGNKTEEEPETSTNGLDKTQPSGSTGTGTTRIRSSSGEAVSSNDTNSSSVNQEHQVHGIRIPLDKIRRSGMWDHLSKFKDGIEDAAYGVKFKARDAYSATKSAVSRVVKGYDSTAVWDCGPQLMVEIPKKLREFADTTIGYPAEYDDPSNWLSIVTRDDDWPDKIAPFNSTRALNPNGDVDNGDAIPVGDDGMLVKCKNDNGEIITTLIRNKDIGLEFAAWIEDVEFAADVIEEWGKASSDVLWFDKYDKLYGHDKAKELNEDLHSKFKIVWAWLGENLPGLWI